MLLTVRRVAIGAIGSAAAATMLLAAAPSALANSQPNCSAADLAGVASGVSAATSAYLFTHPEVNDFFTSLHSLKPEEMKPKVDAYFAANPQVQNELGAVRQPLTDTKNRCADLNGDGIPDYPLG